MVNFTTPIVESVMLDQVLESITMANDIPIGDKLDKLKVFMREHVYPSEKRYAEELENDRWTTPPVVHELQEKARRAALWNLFFHDDGVGLGNRGYAPFCEIMGRVGFAPEVFNCSAPDTGNMELLAKFGSEEQKREWLRPLLSGETRSAFAMTEPAVASSDATNIESSIRRDGDDYILNGRKWWTTGVGNPRCAFTIFMGKSDRRADPHRQQSMIIVPTGTPGMRLLRRLSLFGYDDAPHGHYEVVFDNVRVPRGNLILGEGRGFEIAQGRLGPGRIHHCMRLIGAAERALETMCKRVKTRTAFGKLLSERDVTLERIAESRIEIEQARLLTYHAAERMDAVGAKGARTEIAMIKVVAPRMAQNVIDRAIQSFGSAGLTEDFGLAYAFARARAMRFVDGPDEVHRQAIGKAELKKDAGAFA